MMYGLAHDLVETSRLRDAVTLGSRVIVYRQPSVPPHSFNVATTVSPEELHVDRLKSVTTCKIFSP
jgi:hypothetical protein